MLQQRNGMLPQCNGMLQQCNGMLQQCNGMLQQCIGMLQQCNGAADGLTRERSRTQPSIAQLSRVGEDDADDSEVKESNLNESISAKQAEKKEVEFKIGQIEQQIKERGLGACVR